MSKKIPLGVSIALIFIAIAVSVAVTVTVYMNIYNELIEDLPQRAQMYSNLSDIDELVRANYYGEISSDTLDAEIAKGYISGLDDEYSVYLTAEDYADYYSNILGNIKGIGIDVSFDLEKSQLVVTDVAQGSPAQQSGIEKGDIIKSIENEAVAAENYLSLVSLFDGEKLTSVDIDLYRAAGENSAEKNFSVNVAKGYKAQSCYYSTSGTIGYIKLTAFYENTAETFSQAIDSFNENGVKGIVIDVRNNSSNNIEYAAQVIDLIVPLATEGTGEIATAKSSDGTVVNVYAADSVSVNLPIAVLINDRTEGAGELLACDLRDFGKAKLYGETTCGHGTLQNVFRLDDGGAVLLTVAKIYPYISDSYDKTGVVPDVTVTMSEDDKNKLSNVTISEDAVYKASLDYFN